MKTAPIQGSCLLLPWSLHLRAYQIYREIWGPYPLLVSGTCRGGFCDHELDELIPGWRDEISRMKKLVSGVSQRRFG